jgi:hypothetical protein
MPELGSAEHIRGGNKKPDTIKCRAFRKEMLGFIFPGKPSKRKYLMG